MKKIYVLAWISLGAAIGSVGTFVGMQRFTQNALSVVAEYELTELENGAISAFSTMDAQVSIYAQEMLINFVANREKLGWTDTPSANRISGMANLRIGATLQSSGRVTDARSYYEKAFDHLRNSSLSVKDQKYFDALKEELVKGRKQHHKRK